jgi:diguanylate cyclase (GGDEF)-like protein/PAS domain S-box-containing protein
VAVFIYLSYRQSGFIVVLGALPIIAILLTTGHYFFRHQEAAETAAKAKAAAAEREAEQAAVHLQELELSQRRFHSAFTHASIGMALVAFDGQVRQVNLALCTLLGIDPDASSYPSFADFVSPEHRNLLSNALARVHAAQMEAPAIELRCRHRDGAEVWVAVNCSFFAEMGSTSAACFILQVQDITGRRRAEAELHHIAFHDSLTGLPNRARFHDHLARAIERSRSDPTHQFAVMFLDFDRFKLINDSMGHTIGDEFLMQASRRIAHNVRPGDVVARLGGDEFAILAVDLECEKYAVSLAERFLQSLQQPFNIAGIELTTSASVGITFSAFGYDSPDAVLRDADIAMYRAKSAGKARYALFDVGLHAEVSNRLRVEGDLRRAIAEGQMSIAYQPLYALSTGRISGFEALARWEHPELGVISPAKFIPVAEESGIMVQLTDFVLQGACRQLKAWQQSDPQFAELTMHVNIAGNDVAHSAFVSRVTQAVLENRVKPQHLTIELTENILMERLEGAMEMLNQLHSLGIGLSVDDFGTGYSSLAHLSSLPIDSLKIDRSFVQNLHPGSNESKVIRAIVLLGTSLGMEVIAEGIETPSQMEQLHELGCDLGQGYHLSRPLPAAEVDKLLAGTAMATAKAANILRPMALH